MYLVGEGYRAQDSEACTGAVLRIKAGDAARSQMNVMTRRTHFALFAVLIALGCVPVNGATHASVSGMVRDTAGVPQIGAEVQLLRPDLMVVASAYTDSSGRFSFSSIFPGRYALKAVGASFLPSMRENIRVRSNTIVNLTMNTLYEVMQWLPAQPRPAGTRSDDWAWTLRSAANRPLLRWLEDGPLVVVSDGSGAAPRLKARLMATGQAGTFGESGERYSAMVEATPSNSRELLARVDFDPSTDAGMESMLGFRQDLGMAGSVQSVAAIALHPEVDGAGADGIAAGEGLNEAAMRSWETINLGDEFEAEVGSNQVLARFSRNSPNTVAAALPFVALGWRKGNSTVRYRMTTFMPGPLNMDETRSQAWLPRVGSRDGRLTIEHGLHQEIGWERRTDVSGMAVLVYADSVKDPVLEAMGNLAGGDFGSNAAIFDRANSLLRTAGPDFSSSGVLASVERRLPGGNQVRLSYANGNALVMAATPDTGPSPASTAQVLKAAHPRRAQMYALALSGVIDGTGTRWRASYRWQPEDTVTAVATFAKDAAEPYLSLHIRQPIHARKDGMGGFEALFDFGNLLAEGYQPYVLSDGSVVVFAQDRRSIRAGVAFTF